MRSRSMSIKAKIVLVQAKEAPGTSLKISQFLISAMELNILLLKLVLLRHMNIQVLTRAMQNSTLSRDNLGKQNVQDFFGLSESLESNSLVSLQTPLFDVTGGWKVQGSYSQEKSGGKKRI